MDDWDWGTNTGGSSDTWNMYNWWRSGSDNSGWNMKDYWNSNDPYSSYSNWLDNAGNYDYANGTLPANSSSNSDWLKTVGSLLNSNLGNAAIMGLGSWLSKKDAFNNSKELAELQSKLAQENYAANAAVNEQYYQSHGKQLSDAIGGYKQYYRDPSVASTNPTNIFGLLTPKPTTGPLANGW